MYVDYCTQFTSGVKVLQDGIKARSQLRRYVESAQEQMRQRNIAMSGDTGPVSLFGYLIKPVQRLCQYPLLFKEIVVAMSGDAGAIAVEPLADTCPRGGPAKACYVMRVIEETVNEVNEKVRQIETSARLHAELGKQILPGGKPSAKAHVLSSAGAPGARLQREVRISMQEIAPAVGGRSAPWPRAGSLGKLYLFSDNLVVATLRGGEVAAGGDAAGGGSAARKYHVHACWPLAEVTMSLARDGEWASSGRIAGLATSASRQGSQVKSSHGRAAKMGRSLHAIAPRLAGGLGSESEEVGRGVVNRGGMKSGSVRALLEEPSVPLVQLEHSGGALISCRCVAAAEAYALVAHFDDLKEQGSDV